MSQLWFQRGKPAVAGQDSKVDRYDYPLNGHSSRAYHSTIAYSEEITDAPAKRRAAERNRERP
jgi:hypothetical protein